MVSFYIHFTVKLVTNFLILYVYDAVMERKAQTIKALFVDQTKFSKYFCQISKGTSREAGCMANRRILPVTRLTS